MTSQTARPAAPPGAPRRGDDHPPAADGITVRRVATLAEYQECVAIQHETWGAGFGEQVPASLLQVAQKIGGVVAGAFAPDGRMLGFVFGLPGVVDGRPAHWSDMLAVRPGARGARLGERLKRCQRDLARAAGTEAMFWTFDPLVARNAHLNLTRLGARAVEYVPNMYGADTGSPLHGGVETDRLVVRWDLRAPGVPPPDPDPAPRPGAAAVEVGPDGTPACVRPPPGAPRVRVVVPDDFTALPPARRAAWRDATRAAFLAQLRRGYALTAFRRAAGGALPYYELEPAAPPPAPRA